MVLVALLGGCGLWGMEGGPGGPAAVAASAPTPAAVPVTMGSDGVQRIEIHVSDELRFSPSVVRAAVGTIELTFHNDGLTPHDVQLRDVQARDVQTRDVQVDEPAGGAGSGNINGGGTATVRIRVTAPGTYPFPCVYHSTSGMIGTLIIG